MAEITVAALEPRLQKQVESARTAFERGRHEHAIEAAAAVLKEQPSCLPVRRLLRAAQLKQAVEKSSFGRFMANVSSAPFGFGGSRQMKEQPLAAVACADKLLLRDAHNVAALVLLGEAATGLGWNETAVFAYEAALEPDRPFLMLSLGHALLAAGRAPEAVKAAQRVLFDQPDNAAAEMLLRNASVAVTMAKGKWEQNSDYRGKLRGGQKAAQPGQSTRLTNKPIPPKA